MADTHAVIWYVFGDSRLSQRAHALIEGLATAGDQVGVSPITLIEIVYLAEKGRISEATLARVVKELEAEDTVLVETPLNRRIAEAMQHIDRGVIPDMPDRIIAATAMSFDVPVISRDGKIRLSSVPTVW
ncbi:MAG: type II toxin-antitoxin system VapC family toxin [Caldilineales bacterium]|nr:type II toxin-antitoxin system VapC family toxin [Caldilineales bacterium]